MSDEIKNESKCFDCLAVTTVRVYPFRGDAVGKMKALATVVLNDQLIIRGLRVLDLPTGLTVGYPIDPFCKGEEMMYVCSPVTKTLRDHIENCVIEKYNAVVEGV